MASAAQIKAMDSETWNQTWTQAVSTIRSDISYDESADILRNLIRSGLLRFTDMRDNPARFFEAHRILVDPEHRGPGFWIRFTVQYNLFAGTVLGLGGPEHLAELEEIQRKGELGCFGLTERLAGVNSGLVVKTQATWDPSKQMFVLHCESDGAFKNWISQGLVADKCAVVADLTVEGKSHGPHGFLMDFRRDGKVVDGVHLGDMGVKTTGNDLDNAWIKFDHVLLPKSALLNKYADIKDNKYVQTTKEKMRIEIIGQRLLTGRVAVAQAALAFARKLYDQTKGYSSSKKCWAPTHEPFLGEIPQLKALYSEAETTLTRLDRFLAAVEGKLSAILVSDGIPDKDLVEAIAVAKVQAVENAIALCFRLKQEVGSYALMGGTGFEHLDFLQCCKFAEGDSRILMQKMARDTMRAFNKKAAGHLSQPELSVCDKLSSAMKTGGKDAWNDSWETVYELAQLVQLRVVKAWSATPAKL
eukprot:TRINITY_DN17885_c0_g1_i1.p1 TRINITY_DN17885_c0_g1~~TRINITY_DN17885_c0_g1_i1.p1  ORF type:complete len:473 (+),score=142.25 TRINITY_DN17885_c0_g1_i1:202-1620(+)